MFKLHPMGKRTLPFALFSGLNVPLEQWQSDTLHQKQSFFGCKFWGKRVRLLSDGCGTL